MKKIIVFFISAISLLFLLVIFFCYHSSLKTENIIFTHKSADAKGDKLMILRIVVAENLSLEFVNVDANQKAKLLGSYGEYNLRAIYPLLKLDKRDDTFINATFSYSLKILVSKVIPLEKIPRLESHRQAKQLILDLALGKYGEISVKDRIYLFKLLLRMNDFTVEIEDINDLTKLEFEEDLSDCSVALINSTQKNGLGRDMAQTVEKNGFRVVKVDDSQEVREKSGIFLTQDEARCWELSELLYQVLPSHDKITLNEELFSQHRADIVVLLGEDLIN